MTFSIVARSACGQWWGVAVASRFLAVGSPVPVAAAGIGAVATQAFANVTYKHRGMALLREGNSARETLRILLKADEGRERRQVGIVDRFGEAASHTGKDCSDWAGSREGRGYAIQGNFLKEGDVLVAMESAWLASDPSMPFSRRLLEALNAGESAGGDRRGRQSAALLAVRADAGYGGHDDIGVDLRVDDSPDPIPELFRLLALHDLYLTASTDTERIAMTPELLEEVNTLAKMSGYADFASWVNAENLEMRVGDDNSWVDRKVLAILRDTRRLAAVG